MRNQLLLAVMAIAVASATPSLGDEKNDHGKDKGMSFASVTAGMKTLDNFIAEARDKIGKGDFEGLPETAEELEETAEGLASRVLDINAENRERFKFNTDQLKSISGQLEKTHDSKSKAESEKVVKKLEGVRDRLKALAPAA